jgi:hypothetical protein
VNEIEDRINFLMQFFQYGHLPPHLQAISMHFAVLAQSLATDLPRNEMLPMALARLIEAKDAAVRAKVAQ